LVRQTIVRRLPIRRVSPPEESRYQMALPK
ncbi:hypothetical protein, partial [Mycobacterium canetti]